MNIKLLQWNIWYKENIDNIIRELNKWDVDIICIQELCTYGNNTDNVDKLNQCFPYGFFKIANECGSDRNIGNAIYSKYPITNKKYTFIQEPGEDKTDPSQEGRVYIECEIDIGGCMLNVGTTHSSYTHKFNETTAKDREMNKLIECFNKEEKYIFTGDLNTPSNSKYIKQIQEKLIMCDSMRDKTWATKPFSYNGFVENDLNWKLDYVFKTKDVNVTNCEPLYTIFSDHLPILVNIKV